VRAKHIDKLLVLATQTSDRFQNREVSLAGSVLFQALSAADPDISIRSNASSKGVDQRRLSDAGFSGDKYNPTLASKHLPDPASHSRKGILSTDNSLEGI
jgi:hypothetical protein